MPGREELIQKNKAAVRQNVEAAAELESAYGGAVNAGKKATLPTHRSLFGGNLDVASALDSVEFALKNPLGDGSLRNSVAYIQLWKRGGGGAIASGAAQQIDSSTVDLSSDYQNELWGDVANLSAFWQNPSTTFTQDFSENFDPSPYFKRKEELWEGAYDSSRSTDIGFPAETSWVNPWDTTNITFSQETLTAFPDIARQQAFSLSTPTTALKTATPESTTVASSDQIKKTEDYASSTVGALSGNKEVSSSGVGQLKPANPNGIVNPQSTGSGNRGVGPWLGSVTPPPYSGIAGQAVNGATKLSQNGATLAQGAWQFLFNPSELELVAGPEYKTAETYGVSDKANSGQPLHWTHNKNATLKFNSVLLNGYVFGRKVEQLEQGLIDLFMSRDGGGQSGPHVLEFVWGSRVFGPCVIKDINIKEKMWDYGQVVNAEVSFTLEQIPEWTINDGYVDIARPGKLPLTYDSTDPPAEEKEKDEEKTPPGSGDKAPDQKQGGQAGLTPTALYNKCQRAGVHADQFWKIQQESVKNKSLALEAEVNKTLRKYAPLYNRVEASLGSDFTSRITLPYTDPNQLYPSVADAMKAEDNKTGLNILTRNYENAWSLIENAANSGRLASKSFSESTTCRDERERVDKVTAEQKASSVCKNKQPGALCSDFNISPGGVINTCSGIRLRCAADGFLKTNAAASA